MGIRNAFVLPDSEYVRDLNIIDGTIDDNARYISLMTQDPFEECRDFVREKLTPGGEFALRNPKALILDKNPNGDRKAVTGSVMGFIKRVEKEGLLLSPSMTAYMPESERQSTHALYIEEGVKNRSVVKREMMDSERAATTEKDTLKKVVHKERALMKKGAQNNLKINNNSYSGATVSVATILHYKSTHSSLTSTCRSATSYANASNEKFIRGNRHYYTPEVVKANLISIINTAPLNLVEQAVEQYGLVYPNPDQVMEMITESSRHYWQDLPEMARLRMLVTNMTPVQRAAVMYIGDMYHMYLLNKDAIRAFLFQLAAVGNPATDMLTDEEYESVDGDTKLLATFICYQEVSGRKMKDIKAASMDDYNKVIATAGNVLKTLEQYELMLKAFFLTKCLPSSIHAFPSIRRKAVPISDTDSTMFTLMWWVNELFGHEEAFSPAARRLTFAMVFMVSEVVMHILAVLSRNMGVSDAKLRLLAMKNEYYFEVLSLTARSKHYYASQDALEGLMFEKAKMEVKGVGLRDSKVPPRIQAAAKKMMGRIINTIKSGQRVKLSELLKEVADLERSIIKSLMDGKFEYLSTAQVKPADSYKSDENATYKQYALWTDVFAPSFGETQKPPYQAVKLSLVTHNRTEMELWCERMNNPALASRLRAWMMREGKRDLNTLIIPVAVVESSGIPPEITCAIDTRRVISNVMGAFYIILESLGIMLVEKNNIRLISDYY
jgi:hypothetical protein